MNSCKSAKTSAEIVSVESQNTNQKFYLMLRIAEEDNGKSVRIENIEKKVYTDQSNALPLPPSENAGVTFRCEVLDINGQVLDTHQENSEFKVLTPGTEPEAIVKFIFRVDGAGDSVRVSRELKEGVWEEILTTSIENEGTEK